MSPLAREPPPPHDTKPPLIKPTLPPLPRSIRQNRSFVRLARLIGLAALDNGEDEEDSASDADGDDGEGPSHRPAHHRGTGGDDDSPSDVDEDSLMWDAQTALIAHQPALAAKYYATAALPPYCSSDACLALGNLLARGSGLQQAEETDTSPTASRKSSLIPDSGPMSPRSPQSSWFASFFSSIKHAPLQAPPVLEKPIPRRTTSNGWGIPTEGKRAVRDVEGMGKAGGWLILGIGWILQNESAHLPTHHQHHPQPTDSTTPHSKTGRQSSSSSTTDGDDNADVIVFKNKGKGRAPPPEGPKSPSPASSTGTAALPIPGSNSSSATYESFEIHTPDDDENEMPPERKIKLLYDLFNPLVNLYRHGHIQQHDHVALPPVKASQLPDPLKPQGDSQKGRNVWALGSIVATKVLELPLMATPNLSKDGLMKRNATIIMARYIRGIASPTDIAEAEFKAILREGLCGLPAIDELVRQAYRRLSIILKQTGGAPLDPSDMGASALFLTAPRSLSRKKSTASLLSLADSTISSNLRLMTPVKSTASFASLTCETPVFDGPAAPEVMTPRQVAPARGAVKSLRNVQRHQDKLERAQTPRPALSGPKWPNLHKWALTPANGSSTTAATTTTTEALLMPPRANTLGPHEAESPITKRALSPIRSVASSPHLNAAAMAPPPRPSTMRTLPFEPTEQIAKIDPELAALELASALTKHVNCSVCGAAGVNFPNCRKCGLTFCSRPCRVDEKGAGNGKRHICGAWESRQLGPSPELPKKRGSIALGSSPIAGGATPIAPASVSTILAAGSSPASKVC